MISLDSCGAVPALVVFISGVQPVHTDAMLHIDNTYAQLPVSVRSHITNILASSIPQTLAFSSTYYDSARP